MKFAEPLWLFGTLLALLVGGLLVLGAFKGVRALRRSFQRFLKRNEEVFR